MCFTRKELVLALERGLSVSPLDVSKSQGTQNKKMWSIANMLISFTEMSIARYPQICRKLNDIVPGTQTVGYWTLCPCLFNDRQTHFLEKSSRFFQTVAKNEPWKSCSCSVLHLKGHHLFKAEIKDFFQGRQKE